MLAGLRGGDRDLAVQRVGQRDADGVDERVVEHRPPVGHGALEAHPFRVGPPLRAHVRRHDQPRRHAEVGEVLGHTAIGGRVHPAHPAETDHPDPDRAHQPGVIAISPLSVKGSTNSMASPDQNLPGSYQLIGRLSGSRPMFWNVTATSSAQ